MAESLYGIFRRGCRRAQSAKWMYACAIRSHNSTGYRWQGQTWLSQLWLDGNGAGELPNTLATSATKDPTTIMNAVLSQGYASLSVSKSGMVGLFI